MLIEKLDRTQWRLSQAIDHVAAQIERAAARGEIAPVPDPTVPPWRRSENPAGGAAGQAAREVQVALRDGDLHAQGRLSTKQCRPWTDGLDGWDLHSGHHSTITPEQWRAGRANVLSGVLTMADGQFIDIRVPRFMVLAIWPVIEVPKPSPAPDPATGEPYRTPYMDLLDRAVDRVLDQLLVPLAPGHAPIDLWHDAAFRIVAVGIDRADRANSTGRSPGARTGVVSCRHTLAAFNQRPDFAATIKNRLQPLERH